MYHIKKVKNAKQSIVNGKYEIVLHLPHFNARGKRPFSKKTAWRTHGRAASEALIVICTSINKRKNVCCF